MSEESQPQDVLFEATYAEIRALAAHYMSQERSNHTLQPTALANEAFLRLRESTGRPITDRIHFMNIAAQAMRRILVDHARARNSAKRGGGWIPVTLGDIGAAGLPDTLSILDLDRTLTRLAKLDTRGARVVELRVFGGLAMSEIAGLLGVTRRTVQSDWRVSLMWLKSELALPPEA